MNLRLICPNCSSTKPFFGIPGANQTCPACKHTAPTRNFIQAPPQERETKVRGGQPVPTEAEVEAAQAVITTVTNQKEAAEFERLVGELTVHLADASGKAICGFVGNALLTNDGDKVECPDCQSMIAKATGELYDARTLHPDQKARQAQFSTATTPRPFVRGHYLFVKGDSEAPDSIKDSNGDIALGMCCICHAAEVELDQECKARYTDDDWSRARADEYANGERHRPTKDGLYQVLTDKGQEWDQFRIAQYKGGYWETVGGRVEGGNTVRDGRIYAWRGPLVPPVQAGKAMVEMDAHSAPTGNGSWGLFIYALRQLSDPFMQELAISLAKIYGRDEGEDVSESALRRTLYMFGNENRNLAVAPDETQRMENLEQAVEDATENILKERNHYKALYQQACRAIVRKYSDNEEAIRTTHNREVNGFDCTVEKEAQFIWTKSRNPSAKLIQYALEKAHTTTLRDALAKLGALRVDHIRLCAATTWEELTGRGVAPATTLPMKPVEIQFRLLNPEALRMAREVLHKGNLNDVQYVWTEVQYNEATDLVTLVLNPKGGKPFIHLGDIAGLMVRRKFTNLIHYVLQAYGKDKGTIGTVDEAYSLAVKCLSKNIITQIFGEASLGQLKAEIAELKKQREALFDLKDKYTNRLEEIGSLVLRTYKLDPGDIHSVETKYIAVKRLLETDLEFHANNNEGDRWASTDVFVKVCDVFSKNLRGLSVNDLNTIQDKLHEVGLSIMPNGGKWEDWGGKVGHPIKLPNIKAGSDEAVTLGLMAEMAKDGHKAEFRVSGISYESSDGKVNATLYIKPLPASPAPVKEPMLLDILKEDCFGLGTPLPNAKTARYWVEKAKQYAPGLDVPAWLKLWVFDEEFNQKLEIDLIEGARKCGERAARKMEEYFLKTLRGQRISRHEAQALKSMSYDEAKMGSVEVKEGTQLRNFARMNLARCIASDGFNQKMDSWNGADWLTALVGEVGEMANLIKKLSRLHKGIRGNKPEEDEATLKAKLAEEMADVFIYLDLIAQAHGVNLEASILEKWNRTAERIGYKIRIPASWASSKPLVEANKVGDFNSYPRIMEALCGARGEDATRIAKEGLHLITTLLKKNADYGSSVYKSPALMPTMSPGSSILVRMSDKVQRITKLMGQGGVGEVDETLVDTFRDLAAYAILWLARPEIKPGRAFVPGKVFASFSAGDHAAVQAVSSRE